MSYSFDRFDHSSACVEPDLSGRMRSDGILTDAELASCRAAGISVAFDPMQGGWVPEHAENDVLFERMSGSKPNVGNRIAFRRWSLDDTQQYIALLDDPRIWDHLPEAYPDPLTKDLAEALIEISNSGDHHEVLALMDGRTPVGQVRVEFGNGAARTDVAEISYWLGRDHWGKGLASQAVSAFAARCFDRHDHLNTLIAKVLPENGASLRVLEKAGFAHSTETDNGWLILRKSR